MFIVVVLFIVMFGLLYVVCIVAVFFCVFSVVVVVKFFVVSVLFVVMVSFWSFMISVSWYSPCFHMFIIGVKDWL